MNNDRLEVKICIALGICALALFAVNFLPIWQIDLSAPQYPEGLKLLIFSNRLDGSIDIINGLNHYIGMKTLHTDDFIEFKVLPYLITFFALSIALTALLGRRRLLRTVLALFIIFGIVAMADFWKWEYDYGHNLDPNAAIIVPGMAYQPPLIGFKQLLNFGAYSTPAIGGWIFVGVGLILLLCSVWDWRKQKKAIAAAGTIAMLLSFVLLQGCNTEPKPVQVGIDNCTFCRMTISDPRFACEFITQKGKLYKFDDLHCMIAFARSPPTEKKNIRQYFIADFEHPDHWLTTGNALFLKSDALKSPMGGNTAAFSDVEDQKKAAASFPGDLISWEHVKP